MQAKLRAQRLFGWHGLGDINEAMDALAAGTAMRQVITFDPRAPGPSPA